MVNITRIWRLHAPRIGLCSVIHPLQPLFHSRTCQSDAWFPRPLGRDSWQHLDSPGSCTRDQRLLVRFPHPCAQLDGCFQDELLARFSNFDPSPAGSPSTRWPLSLQLVASGPPVFKQTPWAHEQPLGGRLKQLRQVWQHAAH